METLRGHKKVAGEMHKTNTNSGNKQQPREKGTKFISTYSLCANVSALISFSDPTNVTGKPLYVCVCVWERRIHIHYLTSKNLKVTKGGKLYCQHHYAI